MIKRIIGSTILRHKIKSVIIPTYCNAIVVIKGPTFGEWDLLKINDFRDNFINFSSSPVGGNWHALSNPLSQLIRREIRRRIENSIWRNSKCCIIYE